MQHAAKTMCGGFRFHKYEESIMNTNIDYLGLLALLRRLLAEDRYGREHRRDAHRHLRNTGAEGERVHILPCQVGRSAVHAGRQGQHPAVLAATAGNTPSAVCCSAASAARPTAAWCGHSTARSAPCGAAAAVWITERNTVSIPPRWTKRRSNRQS